MTRGALESSVTLEEVFTVLRGKRVPLAPELAGYLALEIAEHADPTGGDVDPRSVFIGEEGTVALVKPRREAPTGNAETSVRSLLAHLLETSGSQTPALAAASKRGSRGGLAALAGELETALIPVNRAAGRRALARLAREVRRVTLGVGRNALPSSSDTSVPPRRTPSAPHGLPTDAGPAPRPPVPSAPREEPAARAAQGAPPDRSTAARSPIAAPSDPGLRAAASAEPPVDLDALIDRFGEPTPGPAQHSKALKAMAGLEPTPPPAAAASSGSGDRAPDFDDRHVARDVERALAGGYDRPIAGEPSVLEDASVEGTPRRPRRRLLRFALALGLPAAALAAYAVLRPRPFAAAPAAPRTAVATASAAAPRAEARCRGTLVVSDAPPRAEVLLREGQAPVDMERMPVGARLEFVATAEGYVPKRVVVPAAARWSQGTDGRPYLETAVQLDKSRTGDDPWPAGDPGGETGGRGAPGTLRVTSAPRGAEIWLLAGFGPNSRVEQLGCDRAWDVLVAGPGTLRRRMRVDPHDFRAEGPAATPVARLSVR